MSTTSTTRARSNPLSPLVSPAPRPVRDLALLVARVAVGVVFIAHGWQKISGGGLSGTSDGFASMGIPAPTLSAAFAIGTELVGGVLLVLGALVPLVGALLVVNMIGAWVFAHADSGSFFVAEGGPEYVLTLGAAALVLAALGGGRLGVDGLLAGRRSAD